MVRGLFCPEKGDEVQNYGAILLIIPMNGVRD